jgi:hypothetical protein
LTTSLEFSPTELAALKKEHAPGATDEQFELWIADCKRRGLVPVRDVLLQLRTVDEYDPAVRAKVKKTKAIYITTIGAIRKLAERTGKYAGQLPSKWIYLDENHRPTIESEVPLPDPKDERLPLQPWAARATILRKDFSEPISVVARFWAYAQKSNYEGKETPTAMWSMKGRGVEQLEKCAESLAFRKGYPEEIAGLYIAEELMNTEDEPANLPVQTPTVEPPKPASVPEVNHTPAVPTDAPRPNEKPPADVTLTEVLLPPKAETKKSNPRAAQVKAAVETFMENNGKPLPKHEQPVESLVPIGATDDDLPAEMFSGEQPVSAPVETPPVGETVQKMDATELTGEKIREKVRSYDAYGVTREQSKKFCLKVSGAKDVKEISKQQWAEIFEQLDAAAKVSKQAVQELVKS